MTPPPKVPRARTSRARTSRAGTTAPRDDAGETGRYDRLLQLAAALEAAGEQLRQRAALGVERGAERDVLLATAGRGLQDRSLELEAEAAVLRATVATSRQVEELQAVAERGLGSIASRAVGYRAPEIALGGPVVSAGLIETDALDRDELTTYLNQLAGASPELMHHFSSGGGGLLDRLRMRALLTVGAFGGPGRPRAAAAGLSAIGAGTLRVDGITAVRDTARDEDDAAVTVSASEEAVAPHGLEQLIDTLSSSGRLRVQQVGVARFIVYLPGAAAPRGGLRLAGADRTRDVVAAIASAVGVGAHVMLVGSTGGGAVAVEVAVALAAAAADDTPFVVDQVVTVASAPARAARTPDGLRILSLRAQSDPLALLAPLASTVGPDRLTVVHDAGPEPGAASYLAGGRAADAASDAELRTELSRLQSLGYLSR